MVATRYGPRSSFASFVSFVRTKCCFQTRPVLPEPTLTARFPVTLALGGAALPDDIDAGLLVALRRLLDGRPASFERAQQTRCRLERALRINPSTGHGTHIASAIQTTKAVDLSPRKYAPTGIRPQAPASSHTHFVCDV